MPAGGAPAQSPIASAAALAARAAFCAISSMYLLAPVLGDAHRGTPRGRGAPALYHVAARRHGLWDLDRVHPRLHGGQAGLEAGVGGIGAQHTAKTVGKDLGNRPHRQVEISRRLAPTTMPAAMVDERLELRPNWSVVVVLVFSSAMSFLIVATI